MEMKETFQYGIGRLPFVTFDKDDASKERTKERIQDFFDDYDLEEMAIIFIRWSFTQMNLHIFHLVLI